MIIQIFKWLEVHLKLHVCSLLCAWTEWERGSKEIQVSHVDLVRLTRLSSWKGSCTFKTCTMKNFATWSLSIAWLQWGKMQLIANGSKRWPLNHFSHYPFCSLTTFNHNILRPYIPSPIRIIFTIPLLTQRRFSHICPCHSGKLLYLWFNAQVYHRLKLKLV